jgi:type III restriction enzyme
MELKRYQERVISEVGIFLAALAKEQAAGNRHAALDAWDEAGKSFYIPAPYRSRRNGLNKDLPTFCVRVPTGGGKTLLATQILGQFYRTILKDRNGAGLVLWVATGATAFIQISWFRRARKKGNAKNPWLPFWCWKAKASI